MPLVIPNLAQARALQTCKFWNILQAGWKGVSLTASCCLSTSQEACTLQFWGYRQIMFITSLVGKRAICSLCGPSSAAFYCLSSVVAFIAKHFRCYCWPTNIRHYVYTQAYLCIAMCKTLKHRLNSPVSQQALIQLQQSIFAIHELTFFHLAMLKCQSARFDESPDVECWKDQTCLYEKHQWLVLWQVGESIESSEQGHPSPKMW